MNHQGGISAYQQVRIQSSSREALVAILYERLLGLLTRASVQIENGDIEGKADSLGRATEIVFELMASLDFEAGGEIASRLAALYSFFSREISEIGRTLDRERLDRVVEMVASLHEAWAQAAAMIQAGAASADAAVTRNA